MRGPRGERFGAEVVSHAFASKAEATRFPGWGRPGMANRPVGRAVVREEDVRALLATDISRTQLPPLLLCSDDPEWRALVFLLQARAGGFAIAAPSLEDVAAALAAIADEETGESLVLTVVRQVETETSRRRATGPVDAIFADVPWSALSRFSQSRWHSPVPRGHANFYCSGASGAASGFFGFGGLSALASRSRGRRLHAGVCHRRGGATRAGGGRRARSGAQRGERVGFSSAAAGRAGAPTSSWLFCGRGSPGAFAFATRLEAQAVLESSSPRLLRGQNFRLCAKLPECLRPDSVAQSWFLGKTRGGCRPFGRGRGRCQDTGRGAGRYDAEWADLLQKLLAAQTLLLQKLAPKPVDPLSAALQGGGGNEPGSSTGGVRGHTAREAFLKQLEDHDSVAKTIRENACQELGVSVSAVPPGLMREFLDKKVALHEHKTLGFLDFSGLWLAGVTGELECGDGGLLRQGAHGHRTDDPGWRAFANRWLLAGLPSQCFLQPPRPQGCHASVLSANYANLLGRLPAWLT